MEERKETFENLPSSAHTEGAPWKQARRKKGKYVLRPAAAAAAVAILICSSFGICYAADVGGIRQTLTAWINGKTQTVTATKEEDGIGYTFTFEDEDGSSAIIGDGISVDENGEETELSAEEVLDGFAVSVDQKDDGSVWLYYYEKSYNITSLLSDGSCLVAIEGQDGQPLYFDIEENGDKNGGGYSFYCMKGTPEDKYSVSDFTNLDS